MYFKAFKLKMKYMQTKDTLPKSGYPLVEYLKQIFAFFSQDSGQQIYLI